MIFSVEEYNIDPVAYEATESQGHVTVTVVRSGNGTYRENMQMSKPYKHRKSEID